MNRIVFNLKREWYDMILDGTKTVEYRRICEHWCRRINVIWPLGIYGMEVMRKGVYYGEPTFAVFRIGYSRKYPDIVRRITKVDVGPSPYKGWDGEYLRVHFENTEAAYNSVAKKCKEVKE